MLVVLNGNDLQIPDDSTVLAVFMGYINTAQIKPESMLVCVNDEVVSRGQWGALVLKVNDRIEIFRIVGGG
jgi:thiamine biosynthesis protein ThiS